MSFMERIAIDPNVLLGRPFIRGTQIGVEFVLGLLVDGWSEADIRKSFTGLEREDIEACLEYASTGWRPQAR
jgi:uncharacterized protein (DUF433 family)